MAGTASLVGEAFFAGFIENLAQAFGAQFALASELISKEPMRVRTVAFWQNGILGQNFEYNLQSTPCDCVYGKGLSYFPENLQALFPDDKDLVSMGVNSYFGIPLISSYEEVIGHICILGVDPVADSPFAEEYLRIFAARAAAELQRLKTERDLVKHKDHLQDLVTKQTLHLQSALHEAEVANHAKTEFLTRMSHELRTPLNAILGYTELVTEDAHELLPQNRQLIDKIRMAGVHLNYLIDELLDISQIELGKVRVDLRQCHVNSIIRDCIALVIERAKKHNVSIQYNSDINNFTHIMADSARLKQVLINILVNGIVYNSPGGIVDITVNRVPQTDTVRITVTDNGPGIARENLDKIFEQFERLDAPTKCIDGAGVGLAIAKQLMGLMGGTIGVESEKGKGSTFWLEFASA